MSDFREVRIEFLLREVARARAAGEPEPARAEWVACVTRATARVRAVVASYRTVNGDRIPVHDRDEVVNAALDRACRRLLHNLQSFEAPVFYAAIATCAEFACRDYIRAVGARERGLHGSLDDEGADVVLFREALLRDLDGAAAFEAADRLRRGLSDMRNPNQRRAIELRTLGWGNDEIADELGVSVDNAYQLVSRGLRDLRRVMDS